MCLLKADLFLTVELNLYYEIQRQSRGGVRRSKNLETQGGEVVCADSMPSHMDLDRTLVRLRS